MGAGEGGWVVLCNVQGERFLRRVQRVLADLQQEYEGRDLDRQDIWIDR